MIRFENDEAGYRQWLKENPLGYVVNIRTSPDPEYVVLHKSTCGYMNSENIDNYTSGNTKKVCGNDLQELQEVAVEQGRIDGTFSKKCAYCKP